MTDQKRYEEVREAIYDIVLAARTEGIVGGKTKWFARDDTDQILSIPHLFIEGEERLLGNSKLCVTGYVSQKNIEDELRNPRIQAQHDMLHANYKRAIDIREIKDVKENIG